MQETAHLMKHKITTLLFLAGMLMHSSVFPAQYMDLQETLRTLTDLLAEQQKQLDDQRKELAEQRALIEQLQGKQPGAETIPPSSPTESQAAPGEQLAQDSKTPPEAPQADPPEAGSAQEQAKEALAQQQSVQRTRADDIADLQAVMDDPSNTLYEADFPGAWYLPGTTAAMKIGGYVNLSIVDSFDPLLIPDRFIVGSIPPKGQIVPGAVEGTEVSANQTRVNLEYREQTKIGEIRAFVEGDFGGDGDTFRLRHAFGQFHTFLAGKTWSTLMDVNAQPEEVDAEGINGMILVRQAQIRWAPQFGENFDMRISAENPQTDVAGGISERGRADFVASLSRMPLGPFGRWNYRVGFILRDLSASIASTDPSGATVATAAPDNTTGWGVVTGGRQPVSWWGNRGDSWMWQLSYGKGLGRYINDLGTLGVGDAVFDPEGKLQALPVIAGYVSYQHIWPKAWRFLESLPGVLRSSFTVSFVDINNYDFEDGANYNNTLRASANLIYSPTNNVTVGMEFLWGERTNKNKTKGTATQLQFVARYSF